MGFSGGLPPLGPPARVDGRKLSLLVHFLISFGFVGCFDLFAFESGVYRPWEAPPWFSA